MFKRAVQFTVFLRNRTGTFGEFCELFYEQGLGIRALCLHADSEVGLLRMVLDDPQAGRRLLHREGLAFTETEVLVVEVPNQAGMAAGVGHRLAQAKVDIEYSYFSAGPNEVPSLMVFKIDNLDVALARLKDSSKEYN